MRSSSFRSARSPIARVARRPSRTSTAHLDPGASLARLPSTRPRSHAARFAPGMASALNRHRRIRSGHRGGPSPSRSADASTASAALRRLAVALARQQRIVYTVEERLDRILGDLRDLIAAIDESELAPSAGRPVRARSDADTYLIVEAEKGVAGVHLRRVGAGAELRIAGGRPIALTAAMADLLEILLADRPSDDHLIGWKSFAEIEAALARATARPSSRAAVKNLVFRLRSRLHGAHENRFLVQVRRGHGARFALRRAEAGSADAVERSGDDA